MIVPRPRPIESMAFQPICPDLGRFTVRRYIWRQDFITRRIIRSQTLTALVSRSHFGFLSPHELKSLHHRQTLPSFCLPFPPSPSLRAVVLSLSPSQPSG